MSWQAPGQRYMLQDQSLSQPGGPNGQKSCSDHACCVPTAEKHYNAHGNAGNSSTDSGNNAIDGPGSQTLASRMAIEFYNAGSQTFEIGNAPFTYGDGNGRPVASGASYAFNIGPSNEANSTQHYIACSTGTCDCRITEVGGICG